jgi:hypothetical protein
MLVYPSIPAGLSQWWLWEYCMLLICSPVGLHVPEQVWSQRLVVQGPLVTILDLCWIYITYIFSVHLFAFFNAMIHNFALDGVAEFLHIHFADLESFV